MSISNIEIVNESGEVLDPFIRFIVGGSYFIELKKRGGSNNYIPQGKLGKIHVTDVIKFLEGAQHKMFSREIKTIYEASYF